MAYQSDGSNSSFPTLTRHEEYYIAGGDLYFLVEHVNFRVHRYFFERESLRFKGQLTIPASPGASRQGTSESNAIVLEGVSATNFAKFLWVFYNPKYSLYKTTVDDWIIILELAHKWQFDEVKELCVRELEKLEMSDIDRVAAYNEFEVDKNLLVPRYAALCERDAPLSLQEGFQLGMEVAIMIASTREHARANPLPTGARSPRAADLEEDEMRTLVRKMFNIPAPTEHTSFPPMSPSMTTRSIAPSTDSPRASTSAQSQASAQAQGSNQGQKQTPSAQGQEQDRARGQSQGSQGPQTPQRLSQASTSGPTQGQGPPPPDKPQPPALATITTSNTSTNGVNKGTTGAGAGAGAPPFGTGTRPRVDSLNANKNGAGSPKPNGSASGQGQKPGAGSGGSTKHDEKTNQESSKLSILGSLGNSDSDSTGSPSPIESPTMPVSAAAAARGRGGSVWGGRGRGK